MAQTLLSSDSNFDAVATGDFNGDGNADFVAAEDVQNKVYIFLGNGDGTFQTPTSFSVGTDPKALAVGDFGNGADDIAVANSGSNTVTILMNDGTGSFTTSQTLTVGTNPVALALGDFEGNGSLDLAVANKSSNTVSIFLNNGSGTFTLDTTITVGTSPDGVAAGDLNNDGFDDLVVANSGDNNVSVLLSNGDGTFASAVTYTVGTTPTAVVMADFNGSGNLGVAVANGGSINVSVLMGNGDGTLQTATNYSVGSDPVDLVVGEVYGGGVANLVVANHGSNSETILANNGSGSFTAAETIALGESPDYIALSAFNNAGVAYEPVDLKLLTPTLLLSGQVLGAAETTFTYPDFITLCAEKKLPTAMLDSVRGNVVLKGVDGFQSRFLTGGGKDTIEVPSLYLRQFGKLGVKAAAPVGEIYNEAFHAYYQNVIQKSPSSAWVRELIDDAATKVYLPLLKGIDTTTAKGELYYDKVKMALKNPQETAREMVEEAISEMIDYFAQQANVFALGLGVKKTEPTLGLPKGSNTIFGTPQHYTVNPESKKPEKWAAPQLVPIAQTPVPKEIRNLALWIFLYGPADPLDANTPPKDEGTDSEIRQAILSRFWWAYYHSRFFN